MSSISFLSSSERRSLVFSLSCRKHRIVCNFLVDGTSKHVFHRKAHSDAEKKEETTNESLVFVRSSMCVCTHKKQIFAINSKIHLENWMKVVLSSMSSFNFSPTISTLIFKNGEDHFVPTDKSTRFDITFQEMTKSFQSFDFTNNRSFLCSSLFLSRTPLSLSTFTFTLT